MPDVFSMIADERRLTADLLDGLSDEQWTTPSLCSGWCTREVVAHLLMPFSVSLPAMFVRLLKNRFDLDRVSDQFAKNEQRSNAELAAALRANAEHRFTPPGLGPAAPLTDIVVHTQDLCRPLGIDRAIPADRASIVLDFLVSKQAGGAFIPKGRCDGMAFTATDTGWSHGRGQDVTGDAGTLMLAISGRPIDLDELSGTGLDEFASRLAR